MFRQTRYGVYRANEWHQVLAPRILPSAGSRRLVVWCHEGGALGWWWSAQADDRACFSVVDKAGLCAAAADLNGPKAWSNAGALTAIDQLWAQAVTDLGVKSDKILLFGGSMGGLTALNYARHNPTKVQACLAVIPATSLPWHWDHGTGPGTETQTQADLDAAYGSHAAYLAAIPEYSPYEGMDFPAGVPLSIWTSDDDPSVPSDRAQAYAAAVGAEWHSLGAVGHGFANGAFSAHFAKWLKDHA